MCWFTSNPGYVAFWKSLLKKCVLFRRTYLSNLSLSYDRFCAYQLGHFRVFTVYRKSPHGRFSGFKLNKFALNPPNPSFKVRYIDNSVDVCRIQLDIAPPVQGLGTQPVHARATAKPANGLQRQSCACGFGADAIGLGNVLPKRDRRLVHGFD